MDKILKVSVTDWTTFCIKWEENKKIKRGKGKPFNEFFTNYFNLKLPELMEISEEEKAIKYVMARIEFIPV
jgi:hypothetical protein